MADEYYTPEQSWQFIEQYLPNKLSFVYEPFYGKGHTYKYFDGHPNEYFMFGEKGLNFFSSEADETLEYCDCVITNPPFSIKYQVIERLLKYDVPFILMLPMSVMTTKKFRRAIGDADVSFIIPDTRLKYIRNGKLSSPNFDSCYVCYKMIKEKLVLLQCKKN